MRAPHTSCAVSSSMLLQKGKKPLGLHPAASRESREKEEKPPKRDGFCWNRCVRESNNLSSGHGFFLPIGGLFPDMPPCLYTGQLPDNHGKAREGLTGINATTAGEADFSRP